VLANKLETCKNGPILAERLHMCIMAPLLNPVSSVQVLSIVSAALVTSSLWPLVSAAQNLAINCSNMLICWSVSTVSWLDMHCIFNYSA
jgi:hypothetical protein